MARPADMTDTRSPGQFLKAFGPGLLLAAVAVGVSHLVQSTRAGAMYGLAMLVFIVLAIAMKYPAYRFAPLYTAATGATMVEGFRRQGLWALVLFGLMIFLHVFVGIAAVTLVTAGLAKTTLHLGAGPVAIAAGILLVTATLLIIGHYHWLDLFMKLLMVVLTLSTVAATALVVPLIDWPHAGPLWPRHFDRSTIMFTAALIGWMPAPLEAAVIHTMWSQAKVRDTGYQPSVREAAIDFHIGYFSTLLLAICFLLLGTGVMHGSGAVFAESPAGFAAQVIDLYGQTLGPWSRPLIGSAAFAVMFSTIIAALDGFARIFTTMIVSLRRPGEPDRGNEMHSRNSLYVGSMLVIGAGALSILMFFLTSFKTLIDIATTISFLTTPVLALLIHRAMMSGYVPAGMRPGRGMWSYSILCIALMTTFAVGYIILLINR
ncbi:MAG: NRAMP family divalent metal transporter [Gammaproteobacteria bacterium]